MIDIIQATKSVQLLKQGKVIAYPTEAVYGFGCDPSNHQALVHILNLKARANNKGFILIASNIEQIEYYVDLKSITSEIRFRLENNWPGFVTWLLPINKSNFSKIDPIIYGQYDTIAVRVSSHPVVQELCNLFGGAIVSTSANVSGKAEAKSIEELQQFLSSDVAEDAKGLVKGIVAGNLGGYDKPSTIINGLTGEVIR